MPSGTGESGMIQMAKEADNGKGVCAFFVADWCGHCKRLKASGMMEKLAQMGVGVLVADDQTKAAKEMGVQGFPTIMCYKNGMFMIHDGDRTPEAVMKFLGA